jgi:hypothetical protein
VVKQYADAIDKARRQEMTRLKKTLPKEEYRTLKGSHVAFRKHRADLDADEQVLLDRLFAHLPKLQLLYAFREHLYTIFQTAASPHQAADDLKTWIFLVKEQALEPFFPFLDTLQRYWLFILLQAALDQSLC